MNLNKSYVGGQAGFVPKSTFWHSFPTNIPPNSTFNYSLNQIEIIGTNLVMRTALS